MDISPKGITKKIKGQVTPGGNIQNAYVSDKERISTE